LFQARPLPEVITRHMLSSVETVKRTLCPKVSNAPVRGREHSKQGFMEPPGSQSVAAGAWRSTTATKWNGVTGIKDDAFQLVGFHRRFSSGGSAGIHPAGRQWQATDGSHLADARLAGVLRLVESRLRAVADRQHAVQLPRRRSAVAATIT